MAFHEFDAILPDLKAYMGVSKQGLISWHKAREIFTKRKANAQVERFITIQMCTMGSLYVRQVSFIFSVGFELYTQVWSLFFEMCNASPVSSALGDDDSTNLRSGDRCALISFHHSVYNFLDL